MTAGDLSAMLRRHWLLSLAVLVLVIGSGVAAVVLPPDQYRSRAILSIVPADKGSFSFGGAQIVQYLIPPVLTRIQSPIFESGVRQLMPPDLVGAPITILAGNEPGTGIINVDVTSSKRRAAVTAARIADARVIAFPRSSLIRVSELAPASPAKSVKAARTLPIIGGSVVLGLILAIFAAVAASRLRPRLPRGEDFRARFGYEVLGEIPAVRRLPETAAALFAPPGPIEVAAAFRSLEAHVEMRLAAANGATRKAVIAVTSWGEGEGKSTVAANLAWAMASLGHPVTLVDLDLRRPRAHKVLDVALEEGGVAQIARGGDVQAARQETSVADLRIIAAGAAEGHPAQTVHVALPRLAALDDQFLLLDTPPMFATETVEIIGEADAVLLVADSRARRPGEIEEALAELAGIRSKVLGVVLNRVRATDNRGQSSYYAQYERSKASAQPPRARQRLRRR